MADKLHPIIKRAGREFADGKLDRRDFLRVATLLGVAAPVGLRHGRPAAAGDGAGHAEERRHVRLGMRVQDL